VSDRRLTVIDMPGEVHPPASGASTSSVTIDAVDPTLASANPLLDPATAARLADIDGGAALAGLALDLRRSFSHDSDELWGRIDPELWSLTHNPWVVLQTASARRLTEALADPDIRRALDSHLERQRRHFEHETWFSRHAERDALRCVAYFSMEYMLTHALPIYSGGLGNVAGDQLKAASDLGVPVVAVGLLYQQGYFRQVLRLDGSQEALYPYNDPTQLPIVPVRDSDGEWMRVRVPHPSGRLWARAWKAQVGRNTLYLLDTNDPATAPTLRGVASELYGGGPETRLAQELVLGIGGWRLLEMLGVRPDVCHLNEGHAAFAALERARSFAVAHGASFAEALVATRAGNLFTTHTPVDAGFDRFPPGLVTRWLGHYCTDELGIEPHELLALGRPDADHGENTPFTMAFLAMRTSIASNGVSELHGEVSRALFAPLFPRWPRSEVPIGHVTNGIHVPTWDSDAADVLWQSVCGVGRWFATRPDAPARIAAAGDERIWTMRTEARTVLVRYARRRLAEQLALSGASDRELHAAEHLFDPNVLTIGFARRFATYKRPGLLLQDPERLVRLLTAEDRPVQLVVAGKAHPADDAGKELVRAWSQFARRPELAGRVAFLADDDLQLTKHMVQGVDVWLNTPRRPMEASGTSGMKVLVNGGLNLSALDGWWAEAASKDVGWVIGDGHDPSTPDDVVDAHEARELYDLLELEVIPEFYDRDREGVPRRWVDRVRRSMATLTPQYSAERAVRQYTERYYIALARAARARAEDGGALAAVLSAWRARVEEGIGDVHCVRREAEQMGDGRVSVALHVLFGELSPHDVRVELYADGPNGPLVVPVSNWGPLVGAANGHLLVGVLPAGAEPDHFTPRVVGHHPAAVVPFDGPAIRWLG
jgi:starch phosphorylase